jgi:hypothetical protein
MAAFDFPADPEVDQKYTENGVTFIWDGVSWVSAMPSGMTVSATEPEDPSQGDFWWDTTDGILNIYINSEWVKTSTFV